LTFYFLLLGGGLAILKVLPQSASLIDRTSTIALTRAPFWALLAALAGGQLLFNKKLGTGWRLLAVAIIGAAVVYAFYLQRDTVSHWVGLTVVIAVLVWLRWPRLRWPLAVVLVVLLAGGVLTPAVFQFAGGETEWRISGGSRLALIRRVLEVTMRNPITGLGPASYRLYANLKPLQYEQAFYIDLDVSSHNNYVDLFSHTGLLGLGLFGWFVAEVTRLALRLRRRLVARRAAGFATGYANAMLAVWASALVLMLLLDWILPFVYNVGFPGFQASVLVWLFMGGLVALDNLSASEQGAESDRET
jgi:O-antigen ligase